MVYIIKTEEKISEYESERWSQAYTKQIERGALVLPASHTLEAIYDIPSCGIVKLDITEE